MNIVLNYTYTLNQLKRAYRFNVFPTPKAKFFLLFFTCFIFGVGMLAWLFVGSAKINAQVVVILKYILLASWLVWSLMLTIVELNYYYLPIYAFKKSPFHRGNFTVNLIAEGLAYKQLVIEQDNRHEADGFVAWSMFNKKAENEEFIFLFIGSKQSIRPKASFANQSELKEFRTFLTLQSHIKPKKFNRKVIWNN